MGKRSNEIELAIDIVDKFTSRNYVATYSWGKVLRYIEQLEQSDQELLNMQERMLDNEK